MEWLPKCCHVCWLSRKWSTVVTAFKKLRYVEEVYPALEPTTSDKRHCCDKEKKEFKITTGFVLCFVACLILQGGQFGSNDPSTVRLYRKDRQGFSVSQLRNIMTRDTFTFICRYIHFYNNEYRKAKGAHRCETLFKIKHGFGAVQMGFLGMWVAGQHLTIDKSMVKYMGRAMTFNKYMLALQNAASKYFAFAVNVLR